MPSIIFISSSYLRYDCSVSFAEDKQTYVWFLQQNRAGKKTQCILQTHNSCSHFYSRKILAVPEMNSNVIQTKIRFLNPRKVLDVQASWGNLLFIPRSVCSAGTPKEQETEYQKRLQNWYCRADIFLDSSTHSANQSVVQIWHCILFYH